MPRLRREREFQDRIVPPEDLGEHSLCASGRKFPGIHTFVVRQLLTVIERQIDAVYRVSKEPALGQKPREEHTVPVLVGDLVDEMVKPLRAALPIAQISGLSAAHP